MRNTNVIHKILNSIIYIGRMSPKFLYFFFKKYLTKLLYVHVNDGLLQNAVTWTVGVDFGPDIIYNKIYLDNVIILYYLIFFINIISIEKK